MIIVGLAIGVVAAIVLRYARRTERQSLASLALWGLWIAVALFAIGLVTILFLGRGS